MKLIESYIHRIVKESFRKVLNDFNNVTFILTSPANGTLSVTVPYNDFIRQDYKLDYLWDECSKQNPGSIKVYRNGYFRVKPGDPNERKISRYL